MKPRRPKKSKRSALPPVLAEFHPAAVLNAGLSPISEPEIEGDDIQGNIWPGFGTAHLCLLGLKIIREGNGPAAARGWLQDLSPLLTTLRGMMSVREVRRAVARATGQRPDMPDVLVNAALSFAALEPLNLDARGIPDGPFVGGMPSANLNDPLDENGIPIGWKIGATAESTPDILILISSDDAQVLQGAIDRFIVSVGDGSISGLRLLYREEGHRLPDHHEHFGFRDDISNPGVRGHLPGAPSQPITRRYLDPSDPLARRFARPGQPLLWPGQFIFGYATQQQDTDEEPGPEAIPPVSWMRNGSFLVFRRLRQDVRVFWRFVSAQAQALSLSPGRVISPEEVGAWIVGRWKDGSPLARCPIAPNPEFAADDMLVNHFDYTGPAEDFSVIESGQRRVVAGVPGDEDGSRCPFFAHIRKVNLRDKLTDRGPSSQFRLLRRGIPYGLPWTAAEAEPIDRGLLFLSYQRDIEQFLTPSVNWMNQSSAPEGFGHDLLVGQTGGSREAERQRSDGTIVQLKAGPDDRWVIPTGGGFFFAPAISVFSKLRASPARNKR